MDRIKWTVRFSIVDLLGSCGFGGLAFASGVSYLRVRKSIPENFFTEFGLLYCCGVFLFASFGCLFFGFRRTSVAVVLGGPLLIPVGYALWMIALALSVDDFMPVPN